jgi:hypothetical protein
LTVLENKLIKLGIGAKSSNWNDITEENKDSLFCEELIIRNTFMNSKVNQIDEVLCNFQGTVVQERKGKLQWKDNKLGQGLSSLLQEENL